jgi:hypothetical protein
MSLRSYLDLKSGMTVESFIEKWNGRVYIGHAKGVSAFFANPQDLRRFLKIPAKTPSREKLDAWLASLDPIEPAAEPDPSQLRDTGFGPEHHADALDPSDPNHNTRTVV